jgi:hypothetical protein
VLPTLLARWEAAKPDLLVYETLNVGAGVAADLLNIPAAGYAIGQWEPFVPVLHRAAVESTADHWVRRGREVPSDETLLAGLYLDPLPAVLQAADVARIPRRRAVRPVGWSEDNGQLPDWITAGERAR